METGSQTKPHGGEINASWGGLKAALPTTIGIKVYKNICLVYSEKMYQVDSLEKTTIE